MNKNVVIVFIAIHYIGDRLVRAPVGLSWCNICGFYWCWCDADFVFVNFLVLVPGDFLDSVLAATGSGVWIPGFWRNTTFSKTFFTRIFVPEVEHTWVKIDVGDRS